MTVSTNLSKTNAWILLCALGLASVSSACSASTDACDKCGTHGSDDPSPAVPGGSFNLDNGANNLVTVGPFRLDRHEISVARFRKFVAEYDPHIISASAGKIPHDPDDAGWNTAFDAHLPGNAAALQASVKCSTGQQNANYETWTDTPGANDARPINCLDWYVASAFCAWDGGRLPTDAEWNYAAAGGDEQREYPWGSPLPEQNASLAVYGCFFGSNGSGECTDAATNIPPVGSVPAGNGKWGHADLAGSMMEWTADLYAGTDQRVVRGGSWSSEAAELKTTYRSFGSYGTSQGARCARAE